MPEDTVPHGQVARLLLQHRTALYGYIFACVRNHDDAEDILQNVAVAVTESITRLTDEAGFLPWAREIARRRILAHRRSSRREQPFDPELVRRLAEAADRVEQVQPASNQRAALLACLEKLPGASRQLILMRYDGSAASAEELATHFGRSVQGIYAQLKRIKVALRQCVERRLVVEGSA
jgi:RNA polymerase sigma-70 factor (ECF subfamily)